MTPRIDTALTIAFYLLVVLTLLSYFFWRHECKWVFMTLGIAAMSVRAVYYIIKLL